MMSKFVYAAVVLAGVVLSKDYSNDYNDYSDSSSSSSSEVAAPVYLPPGNYFVCSEGGFANPRRCLTYKKTPPPKEDSSSSSCGKDDSSVSKPYLEGRKYRYVYGSKKFASVFTLSYPNATTDAFQLRCKTCENEFHGALVSMVRHHLEFVKKGSAYVQEAAEFHAYTINGKTATYNVRTTEKVHLIRNWWQLSTFRKRVEIGMKPRAMKVQLYRAIEGAFFASMDVSPVEGSPMKA